MSNFHPIFRSPIAGPVATAKGAELHLIDLSGVPIIVIQGEAEDALKKQFSDIPAKPGDVVEIEAGFLARLTPQEFYLFGNSAEAKLPSATELEASFEGDFAHTTDYTHGQTLLKLRGAEAAEALSKICGLDFHDPVFPNMRVKQTSAAKIKTLLARIDENGEPTYHLHVSRPLGQYFWETLWDAGQEFGIGAV
jgi:heterotetrameric sarcosine oxidase gamma subunit